MALGVEGVHCFVSITIVKRSAPAAWRTGTPAAVLENRMGSNDQDSPRERRRTSRWTRVLWRAGQVCYASMARPPEHPRPAFHPPLSSAAARSMHVSFFGWAGSPSARPLWFSAVPISSPPVLFGLALRLARCHRARRRPCHRLVHHRSSDRNRELSKAESFHVPGKRRF